MAKVLPPSPEHLRERLRYDEETGRLYWRAHPSMPVWWNTRFAEQEAFATINGAGYRQGYVCDYQCLGHRVVWAVVHGRWPVSELDHKDRDRQNNRIDNLREASVADNRRNATRYRSNTSGHTGISRHARNNKWVAHISVNYRSIYLGSFETVDDAIAARKAAEEFYGFSQGHGSPRGEAANG